MSASIEPVTVDTATTVLFISPPPPSPSPIAVSGKTAEPTDGVIGMSDDGDRVVEIISDSDATETEEDTADSETSVNSDASDMSGSEEEGEDEDDEDDDEDGEDKEEDHNKEVDLETTTAPVFGSAKSIAIFEDAKEFAESVAVHREANKNLGDMGVNDAKLLNSTRPTESLVDAVLLLTTDSAELASGLSTLVRESRILTAILGFCAEKAVREDDLLDAAKGVKMLGVVRQFYNDSQTTADQKAIVAPMTQAFAASVWALSEADLELLGTNGKIEPPVILPIVFSDVAREYTHDLATGKGSKYIDLDWQESDADDSARKAFDKFRHAVRQAAARKFCGRTEANRELTEDEKAMLATLESTICNDTTSWPDHHPSGGVCRDCCHIKTLCSLTARRKSSFLGEAEFREKLDAAREEKKRCDQERRRQEAERRRAKEENEAAERAAARQQKREEAEKRKAEREAKQKAGEDEKKRREEQRERDALPEPLWDVASYSKVTNPNSLRPVCSVHGMGALVDADLKCTKCGPSTEWICKHKRAICSVHGYIPQPTPKETCGQCDKVGKPTSWYRKPVHEVSGINDPDCYLCLISLFRLAAMNARDNIGLIHANAKALYGRDISKKPLFPPLPKNPVPAKASPSVSSSASTSASSSSDCESPKLVVSVGSKRKRDSDSLADTGAVARNAKVTRVTETLAAFTAIAQASSGDTGVQKSLLKAMVPVLQKVIDEM